MSISIYLGSSFVNSIFGQIIFPFISLNNVYALKINFSDCGFSVIEINIGFSKYNYSIISLDFNSITSQLKLNLLATDESLSVIETLMACFSVPFIQTVSLLNPP